MHHIFEQKLSVSFGNQTSATLFVRRDVVLEVLLTQSTFAVRHRIHRSRSAWRREHMHCGERVPLGMAVAAPYRGTAFLRRNSARVLSQQRELTLRDTNLASRMFAAGFAQFTSPPIAGRLKHVLHAAFDKSTELGSPTQARVNDTSSRARARSSRSVVVS